MGKNPDTALPPEPIFLANTLQAAQNTDGGWPYRSGSSWTEPTVLSLLALSPGLPEAIRGYAWTGKQQRSDGGWPPQPNVDQTTWVTSLVALLPPPALGVERHRRAIAWILAQTAEDATAWFRLRQWLRGSNGGEKNPGWPWFPGTAAWVTPTSLSILALRQVARRDSTEGLRLRIAGGQQFLLSRVCTDGGWNHGSSRALGYDGESYPETTGVALLALAGVSNLQRNVAAAQRHWERCRSAEGAAWLKLGLLAQGYRTSGWPAGVKPHNLRDTALCVLAETADRGRNVFLHG